MSRVLFTSIGAALVATMLSMPVQAQQRPQIETTKVDGTDNVYIFRNGNHQSMFVVTKDGVIVISHDPILEPPVCTGPQPRAVIHQLTLTEVRQWDCGAVQNPRFATQHPVPGTRMPNFFVEVKPGELMSPVPAMLNAPTFAAQKQQLRGYFSSDEEMNAYLSDVSKVTGAC